MPVPRYGFGTAINKHKLYCFGGDHQKRKSVVDFNIYGEVWVDEEIMSEPYVHPSAVTVYEV